MKKHRHTAVLACLPCRDERSFARSRRRIRRLMREPLRILRSHIIYDAADRHVAALKYAVAAIDAATRVPKKGRTK